MDANDRNIRFVSVSEKLLLEKDALIRRRVTNVAVKVLRAYIDEKGWKLTLN